MIRRKILAAIMGGKKAFTPTDLSGLQFWFDASKITGLVDDDPVATWNDLSGYDRHASQITAGNRPVYKTNVSGGKPAVRFTAASSHYLTCGNQTAFHGAAGLTVVATLMHTSDALSTIFFSQHVSGTSSVFFCGVYPVATGYFFTVTNSTPTRVNVNYPNYTSTDQYVKLAYRYNGAVLEVFVNDVEILGGPPEQTGVLQSQVGPVVIGSYNTGSGLFWDGDILELVAYNRALTDAEMLLL